MNPTVSIQEVIQFIRNQTGISETKLITLSSMLESDLGITGDDGTELFMAAEIAFEISFSEPDYGLREFFNLKENEYLFHSEGIGSGILFGKSFRLSTEIVKSISVGDFHQAISTLQGKKFEAS